MVNKNQSIAVDPIRRQEDIDSIKRLLSDSPRDHLLFTLGINNGIRVVDLLRLKVKQVMDVKPNEFVRIKESKTGKSNVLYFNKAVHKSLRNYLDRIKPNPDDFLFKSRKGDNEPLQSQAVSKLVKKWTKAINLRGTYGAHTLRKTFGYIQRTKHGVGFEVLGKRYNHSSPAITMRYLGIQDKEVNGILMNEI